MGNRKAGAAAPAPPCLLKPDNPKRIAEGRRRVAKYKEYLANLAKEPWTGVVDVYKSS